MDVSKPVGSYCSNEDGNTNSFQRNGDQDRKKEVGLRNISVINTLSTLFESLWVKGFHFSLILEVPPGAVMLQELIFAIRQSSL